MDDDGPPARTWLPAALGIVIPARDEEALIGCCVTSVLEATTAVAIPATVVVALDRCADRTAEIVAGLAAAGNPVRTVVSSTPGVGAARAAGMRELLAAAEPESLWLATTDADSVVPRHWLTAQLQHAERGADVVVGTVHVEDWTGHPPNVPSRYSAGYRAMSGHRHVHGANLGLRATHYLAAGGFPELDCDEDVVLVGRLEALGSALVWAADGSVTTSARTTARAPHGFAAHLLSLAEATDVG